MLESCKTCAHYGRDCIPFVMSLPVSDLIAWMRIRKDALRLSNADIAEAANVPKGTVDRIFSSSGPADFRFSTVQPIVRVLAGCTQEELTCSPLSDASLAGHVAHLEDTISCLKAENSRQVETISNVRLTLNDMKGLARRRMRIISVLAIGLAAALLLIIIALALDRIDPDRGFLWIGSVAEMME